jgi:hypothetical protein
MVIICDRLLLGLLFTISTTTVVSQQKVSLRVILCLMWKTTLLHCMLLTASAVLLNLLTLGILSWKSWNTGRDEPRPLEL